MSEYHTVETLYFHLKSLIEMGYKDWEVAITYDNGYGITSAHKNVSPRLNTETNTIIFAEDDEFVKGFSK